MRIAFFVTQFPKFSEVFILNQALALLDRGHDVQVFSLTRSGEADVQPGADAHTGVGVVVGDGEGERPTHGGLGAVTAGAASRCQRSAASSRPSA